MKVCFVKVEITCLNFGRPFVEYKGVISQNEWETKRKQLEEEANVLISKGGRVSCIFGMYLLNILFVSVAVLFDNFSRFNFMQVSASVLPYEKASDICGGSLPEYIPKVWIDSVSMQLLN